MLFDGLVLQHLVSGFILLILQQGNCLARQRVCVPGGHLQDFVAAATRNKHSTTKETAGRYQLRKERSMPVALGS